MWIILDISRTHSRKTIRFDCYLPTARLNAEKKKQRQHTTTINSISYFLCLSWQWFGIGVNERKEWKTKRHKLQIANGTRAIIRLSYNHTNKQNTNIHHMQLATVEVRTNKLPGSQKYKQVHAISKYSRNALELHNLNGKWRSKTNGKWTGAAKPSRYIWSGVYALRSQLRLCMLNLQTVSNLLCVFFFPSLLFEAETWTTLW